MLSLPTQTGRNGVPCKTAELLNEAKKKKEIFFEKACEFKKKLYFCSRLPRQPQGTKGKRNKIVRHVHRHIGLTA